MKIRDRLAVVVDVGMFREQDSASYGANLVSSIVRQQSLQRSAFPGRTWDRDSLSLDSPAEGVSRTLVAVHNDGLRFGLVIISSGVNTCIEQIILSG